MEVHKEVLAAVREGVPIKLESDPPRKEKANQPSTTDPRCMAELKRYEVEVGALEGPLSYKPHIVAPMHCIVKEETGKVRVCYDANNSGLNEHCYKLPTKYYYLSDAIEMLTPGCW